MEIENDIVELMRTCLMEEWAADKVTDDKVKSMIEMTLAVSVLHDMDRYDLPLTTAAMAKYLEGRGIPVDQEDFADEEGDSDAEEEWENEVEFKETPYPEENS